MNNYLDDYLNIGIDDTDSPRKGCTTYIAALATEYLETHDCVFIDYPNLVRLNPTIPWKTRGNGAIALRIHCPYKNEERMHFFQENRNLWKPGAPTMKDSDLIIAICKEKNWKIKY